MNIEMVGIDHNKAAIEHREAFAFTKAAAGAAMQCIKSEFGAEGCIIFSTCNRTELWLSRSGENALSPAELLCRLKGISAEKYNSFLTQRTGEEALSHILEMTCGLKSQIFGEEQIITQVGEALADAHDCSCADSVLERLFRTAVTAAKRVKTTVRLTAVDTSVASRTIELLRSELESLQGVSCLVIGNGEIGRLTAAALAGEGGDVKMTLRHYKKGEAVIPNGCEAIEYENRLEAIKTAKVVVSATTSPHYTLHYEDVLKSLDGSKKIFIDLAVPRDISPRISAEQGVVLYDIDTLSAEQEDNTKSTAMAQVSEILNDYRNEFNNWYYFRGFVPKVNDISTLVARDITGRIQKSITQLELGDSEQRTFEKQVEIASARAVSKLMFGLRDYLAPDKWNDCIESIEKAVQR